MDGTGTQQTPWQRLGSKFTLGLRSRAEADWLPHEDAFGNSATRENQLTQKADLLANRRDEVFACDGSGLAACAEVRDMVAEHLADHHHGQSDNQLAALAAAAGMHPLEQAARAVPEDLLLLAPRERDGGGDICDWVLVSAALAFPAHWVLAEKMGRPLAGIHGPVPHYGERLERPMDRFFSAMEVGPISHRWNWSVVTTDRLFTPHRMRRVPLAENAGLDEIYLRMESQTLRKLPRSGHILFTIRTYVMPLSRWADQEGAIESLVEMLDGMTPQMRAYKGVEMYEDALRATVAKPC